MTVDDRAVAERDGPDAGLIAASQEFEKLSRDYHDTFARLDFEEASEATDPLLDRRGELLDGIIDTPAVTMEGVIARARAVAAHEPSLADPYTGDPGWGEDMARAVLRDLLALTEGAA